MKHVAQGRRFRVVDDFLDERNLASVRALASSLEYEQRPSVVDGYADGDAYRSRGAVLWHDKVLGSSKPAKDVPAPYQAVMRELCGHPSLLGDAGTDWSVVGLTFWQYLAGSRLGWHNDARSDRRGEFILFLHDTWRASWGGELLLLDRDPSELPPTPEGLSPFEAVEHAVDEAEDVLVAIVPKPNRLVIVQEGTSHCIQRVDRTAGSHVRQTMTGFVASSLPEGRRDIRSTHLERLTPFLSVSAQTDSQN